MMQYTDGACLTFDETTSNCFELLYIFHLTLMEWLETIRSTLDLLFRSTSIEFECKHTQKGGELAPYPFAAGHTHTFDQNKDQLISRMMMNMLAMIIFIINNSMLMIMKMKMMMMIITMMWHSTVLAIPEFQCQSDIKQLYRFTIDKIRSNLFENERKKKNWKQNKSMTVVDLWPVTSIDKTFAWFNVILLTLTHLHKAHLFRFLRLLVLPVRLTWSIVN